MPNPADRRLTRRTFLRSATLAGAAITLPGWMPRPVAAQPAAGARPAVPHGVQSGDVGHGSAVVWSATDRPARMLVEYATTDSFADARRLVGPAALPETGHAARSCSPSCRPVRTCSIACGFRTSATSSPPASR